MGFGILCSVATGLCQPLNTYIFGTLTGEIIEHAKNMASGNLTGPQFIKEADLLIDAITNYALYNSLLGIGMMIFSYFSIILFNYSALRQVNINSNILVWNLILTINTDFFLVKDILYKKEILFLYDESRYFMV